jgi:hypothetical protein
MKLVDRIFGMEQWDFSREKETAILHIQKYIILRIGAKRLVAYWQSMDRLAITTDVKFVPQFIEKAPAYSSVTN